MIVNDDLEDAVNQLAALARTLDSGAHSSS